MKTWCNCVYPGTYTGVEERLSCSARYGSICHPKTGHMFDKQ